jgi:hypothetical protein
MQADSDEVDNATFLANVEADEDDEDFFVALLAAYGHTCGHDELTKAKAETEHLAQRPRLLRAETWHAWIRAVVRSTEKKWDGIRAARDHLGAPERSIWRVIADAPAAPKLDRERMLKLFARNIQIAEAAGDTHAAEFLRRQLRRFERSQAD